MTRALCGVPLPVLALVSALGASSIATLVALDATTGWDEALATPVRGQASGLALWVTRLVEPVLLGFLLAGLAVVAARRGRLHLVPALVAALATDYLLVQALKLLFARARPDAPLIPEDGFSFPSTHTSGAAVLAVFAFTLLASSPPGARRALASAGAAGFALAVGWSRLALGVHHPSDVAAAPLFGLAVAAVFLHGCERFRALVPRVPPRAP